MAELVQSPKKWIVRCPCGAIIKYGKNDTYEKTINNDLSGFVKVNNKLITCPECGKDIPVYFSRFS